MQKPCRYCNGNGVVNGPQGAQPCLVCDGAGRIPAMGDFKYYEILFALNNNIATGTLTINDADVEVVKLVGSASAAAGLASFTLQITDQTTGRAFVSGATTGAAAIQAGQQAPAANILGTAANALYLPKGYVLAAKAQVKVDVTDLSGGVNNVRIGFHCQEYAK